MVGYGATVGSAYGGLDGRDLVSIVELTQHPLVADQPKWLEPRADGPTPMGAAIAHSRRPVGGLGQLACVVVPADRDQHQRRGAHRRGRHLGRAPDLDHHRGRQPAPVQSQHLAVRRSARAVPVVARRVAQRVGQDPVRVVVGAAAVDVPRGRAGPVLSSPVPGDSATTATSTPSWTSWSRAPRWCGRSPRDQHGRASGVDLVVRGSQGREHRPRVGGRGLAQRAHRSLRDRRWRGRRIPGGRVESPVGFTVRRGCEQPRERRALRGVARRCRSRMARRHRGGRRRRPTTCARRRGEAAIRPCWASA